MRERLLPKGVVKGLAVSALGAALTLYGSERSHLSGVDRSWIYRGEKNPLMVEKGTDSFRVITHDNTIYEFPGKYNYIWKTNGYFAVGSIQGEDICSVTVVEDDGDITTFHDKGIDGFRVNRVTKDTINYMSMQGYELIYKAYSRSEKVTYETSRVHLGYGGGYGYEAYYYNDPC